MSHCQNQVAAEPATPPWTASPAWKHTAVYCGSGGVQQSSSTRSSKHASSWRRQSRGRFPGRIWYAYIAADLPLAARRRKTVERLMNKATAEGREVSVADGVLSIDSQEVFSLDRGYVQQMSDCNANMVRVVSYNSRGFNYAKKILHSQDLV